MISTAQHRLKGTELANVSHENEPLLTETSANAQQW